MQSFSKNIYDMKPIAIILKKSTRMEFLIGNSIKIQLFSKEKY